MNKKEMIIKCLSEMLRESDKAINEKDFHASSDEHELRTVLVIMIFGMFFQFSGLDTCDKKTQLELVHECLRQMNHLTKLAQDGSVH